MNKIINIPHIDGHIWNAEYKVIEILSELNSCGTAIINIDNEGSDLVELGLYSLLDQICSTFNYPQDQIKIQTRNQLESHPLYQIEKLPPLYISSGQKFANINVLPEKQIEKHFGIFIGRSNWRRLWLSSYLYKNFKEKTSITFHYDSLVDYHRAHIDVDKLLYEIGSIDTVNLIADFLLHLPIKNDNINSYPILTPAHFNISKVYREFFVEIVCETFCAGQSFYPTEKTWRPFICRTPFLVQGPRDFLKNLRKLGFKTFGNWWDESYDEDVGLENGKVSIRTIQKNIDMLANLTTAELHNMLDDMKDTLDYNYQRFMSLSEKDFKSIWP